MFYLKKQPTTKEDQALLDQINAEMCHIMTTHYYTVRHHDACMAMECLASKKNEILFGYR